MSTAGIILAAGKETRLHPYTNSCPKPILQAFGSTYLDSTLDAMKVAQIADI